MSRRTVMVALASTLLIAGCAGGRTSIVAGDASYPVSLSEGVRDRDGELVEEERKDFVGTYEDERMAWGTLYSSVKLTPTKDISKQVDAQVKKVRGDAVINLRVATEHCGWNFVPILNLLPVWPGCTTVKIKGDIVRVAPKAPRRPNAVDSAARAAVSPR
jgi:hypothetical protein